MTVPDGAVLLHTGQEIYFGLNTVGARIWELLRPDVTSIEDVCAVLGEQYPQVDAADLHEDVVQLLDALERDGLVLPAAH